MPPPARRAWARLARWAGYATGPWMSCSVTAGIPSGVRLSGGEVSFKLTTTERRWLGFSSRESLGSQPQLTITTLPTPASPTPGSTAGPLGVPGSWTHTWGDEFAGSSVDTAKWNLNEGKVQNGVTNHATNVLVTGGSAVLSLPSSASGAMLSSGIVDGWGTNRYTLPVGGCAEARISFPGDGTTIDNWPAWWTVGNGWPRNGENDIAEGLGRMTVNYHATTLSSGWHIPGTWSNGYHVYGLHRLADRSDVYYDGVLVKSYPTADPGTGHALVLNLGNGYGPAVYGTASQMKVDYVRAYSPA